MRRMSGFTLIELMITLAVVAILAAVAFPSYQDHLRKGRRASAEAFIMEIANRQQQYLLDARTYAVDPGALTTLTMTVPSEVSQYYGIAVTAGATTSPPSYKITAKPTGGQVTDGVLTLDSTGDKTRHGKPGW